MPPPNISPSIPAAGALASPLSVPQKPKNLTVGKPSIRDPIKPAEKNTIHKEKRASGAWTTPALHPQVRFWPGHCGSLAHPHGQSSGRHNQPCTAWGRDFLLPAAGMSSEGPGWNPTCSQGAASSPEILQSCTTSILGRRLRHAAGCAR